MPVRNAMLALAATVMLGGCYGTGGKTELFMKSSLDVNLGQPHRLKLARADLQRIADQLIELARQRELTLVQQTGCGKAGSGCSLAFRGKPVDRRIFRGPQSHTMSYYSRYFLTLQRNATEIQLAAIGVPVLGGEMACPPRLQSETGCAAPKLRRPCNETFTASVKRQWGYDVSGANEAETLTGLLAELRRAAVRPAKATVARLKIVGTRRTAPTADDRKAYERLRQEGKACYRERDYRCALDKFASAQERVPDPAMRFNLASAQDKLGLSSLAVRNYRHYLKEAAGSVPAQALGHITRRMKSLLPRVGQVQLEVTPADAGLLVNEAAPPGALVKRAGTTTVWDLVLDPGSYQVELRRAGYSTRSLTVTVLAGEQRKISLSLTPTK